jgi:hypothetical protein
MATNTGSRWVSNKIAGKDAVKDLSPITTTYTAGARPAVTGTQTIANAATPTVVELLKYCSELDAKVEALAAALKTP